MFNKLLFYITLCNKLSFGLVLRAKINKNLKTNLINLLTRIY